jgi:hypothetical protein
MYCGIKGLWDFNGGQHVDKTTAVVDVSGSSSLGQL